jgi:hypothetical protein
MTEVLGAKLRLFRGGDPDAHELSHFTDFAILETTGSARRPGVVRILEHRDTRYTRLLMRDSAAETVLLNHFLVPGLSLAVADGVASYDAHDFADATGRALTIRLTFESPAVCRYFEARFADAILMNDDLIPVERFLFWPGAPFEGIIAHLTRLCGGNVHDQGVVEVTATAVASGYSVGSLMAKNVADLESNTFFHSPNHGRDSWLCYNFKNRRVRATHYSLRTHFEWAAGATHLRNWVLEGSNPGATWVELDRRADDNSLNGPNAAATFPIAEQVDVQMLRIRQNGPNHDTRRELLIVDNTWTAAGWGGQFSLVISAWELFGTIIE